MPFNLHQLHSPTHSEGLSTKTASSIKTIMSWIPEMEKIILEDAKIPSVELPHGKPSDVNEKYNTSYKKKSS